MKYRIYEFGELLIINDSGKAIFAINKYNNWGKKDYDQNGEDIYFEDSDGYIIISGDDDEI